MEGTCEFTSPDGQRYIVSFDTASDCTADGWYALVIRRSDMTFLSPQCRLARWLVKRARIVVNK